MATRYDVTEEQMAALIAAQRWSWAVGVQGRRLADGQDACVAAWRSVEVTKHIGHPYEQVWWVMEADRHYLLVAARNLVEALERWGETYPDEAVDQADIKMLRNWHEHPEGEGSAARRYRKLDVPPGTTIDDHQWGPDDALLGGRLRVKALREWAERVHGELRNVDAWPVSLPT